MPIALPDEKRAEAIESIQQYALENFDDPLGNLAAGSLLDFFLTEIGPVVYNQAVRDAQERVQAKVMDLDVELAQLEFDFWKSRKR